MTDEQSAIEVLRTSDGGDTQKLRQIIINLTNAAAIVLSRIEGLGDEYKGYLLRNEVKWALRDAGIKEGDDGSNPTKTALEDMPIPAHWNQNECWRWFAKNYETIRSALANQPPPTGEGVELLKMVLRLMPGWREAICELEDYCSEPVRLKNMTAATDQIDRLYPQIRAALKATARVAELQAEIDRLKEIEHMYKELCK